MLAAVVVAAFDIAVLAVVVVVVVVDAVVALGVAFAAVVVAVVAVVDVVWLNSVASTRGCPCLGNLDCAWNS